MSEAYCTLAEVFLALTARAFVVRPMPVEEVDASTGTIKLTGHGLTSDDIVTTTTTSGGDRPAEISGTVAYGVEVVSADLLRLTTDGIAIAPFSADGLGWSIKVDPYRRIGLIAILESRAIDQCLTAHATPIKRDPVTGKYPENLTRIAARCTARAAVASLQIENAAYRVAVDRLFAQEVEDTKQKDAWRAGQPLLPAPIDQTVIADNGARAESSRAAVPWTTGTL